MNIYSKRYKVLLQKWNKYDTIMKKERNVIGMKKRWKNLSILTATTILLTANTVFAGDFTGTDYPKDDPYNYPSVIAGYEVEGYLCDRNTGDVIWKECTSPEGHDWEEWGKINPIETPDCSGGYADRHCKICGWLQGATLKPTEHVWDGVFTETQKATCERGGIYDEHCTSCGARNNATRKYTDPLPHTVTNWTIDQKAPCMDGTRTGTCSVCGKDVQEVIKASQEHNWGDWYILQEAKPNKKGYIERDCENNGCNAADIKTYNYGEDPFPTEPTEPTEPTDPSEPTEKPTDPTNPSKPTEPTDPSSPTEPETRVEISYRTHVQNEGWQNYVTDGEMSGTKGKSLRLEGIEIRLNNTVGGSVEYRTHVQNEGWQDYVTNGEMSGTKGKSLRLEAIQIRLTGELAEAYDIYYRTHIQDKGWLGWAMNDEKSGSAGLSKRLEAIEIRLVEKGNAAPGNTDNAYLTNQKEANPTISYRTHVQNEGWQDYVTGGELSGTKGKSLRLEAIQIKVNGDGLKGSVEYATHVQNQGWQDYVAADAISGTRGKSLRLEAIKIRLTGELAQKYSVEYRTHVQNEGWQQWVKDDAMSGTKGKSLRLEAIEIRLVKK